MAQLDRERVAIQVTGEQRLQIVLAEALAEATGRALRDSGHQPPPEQLRQIPRLLVLLAGVQAEQSFADGPPRVTVAAVEAWAEQAALDLVAAIFGPPVVLN